MTITTAQKNALKEQVEFYFSDVNIVKDTFLKARIAEDPNGFVKLSVLLTFNRVKSLTNDAKKLFEVLKDSDKIVLDSERLTIARCDPIPQSPKMDCITIYCKPIPAYATLEELHDYFGRFGNVKTVWRRYLPGATDSTNNIESMTKTSIFVLYSTLDEVERLIKDPPQYEGVQLFVQSKTKYMEAKSTKVAPYANKAPSTFDNSKKSAVTKPVTSKMPNDACWSITDVGDVTYAS